MGEVMLVSSAGIAFPFHEVLPFYIFFADAVENDVDVDVAGMVVAVFVGADQSLVSGEVLFRVIHTDGLCLLHG